MVTEDREIVDRRRAETLNLFQATARQEAAAEERAGARKTPQSRRWERENPSFTYRIRPGDDERITAWAGQLGATKDEIARGLMAAALEAMEEGWLWLVFDREVVIKEVPVRTPSGRITTRRIPSAETDVKWTWGERGKSCGQT